ncbi:DUF6152 family protein [Sphingomonas sp.]|jgi:hypothetical protein|uniref:DUF6152 family protein n=1 Tax=Sphingomonas sp. TaxID=28214 RepID=UPI002ED7EF7F
MLRYSTLAALAIAVPAAAHHGWSSYDESKPLTTTGPLTNVTWGNPHGAAQVVRNKKPWAVVLAPVARMEARGLSLAMIDKGQKVTLVGYARRDGAAEMRIERVIVGDKTVELR